MFEETDQQRAERLKQRALELAIGSHTPDEGPLEANAVIQLAQQYYDFMSS